MIATSDSVNDVPTSVEAPLALNQRKSSVDRIMRVELFADTFALFDLAMAADDVISNARDHLPYRDPAYVVLTETRQHTLWVMNFICCAREAK